MLELPSVRRGLPDIVAGAQSLTAQVHWIHVCEQPDMENFLNGGELVLTGGTGLEPAPEAWVPLIDAVCDSGSVGFIIELGRYHESVPDAGLARARERELPLITLQRAIRFVDVTHSVHKLIRDRHAEELRQRIAVHETFTQLTVSGADAEAIVQQVGKMLECPVVLENLAHQVLACHNHDRPILDLLDGWEQRSRDVQTEPRTAYDPSEHWLLTKVGAHDEPWGRLIILPGTDPPDRAASDHALARTIAERAADALALRRLIERDRETLEHQSQRTLLNAILDPGLTDTDELTAKARALGVELIGRQLIGGCVRIRTDSQPRATPQPAEARQREYIAAIERATAACPRVGTLIASSEPDRLLLVASLPAEQPDTEFLDSFASEIHRQLGELPWSCGAIVGFGTTTRVLPDVARSCAEAKHAATAADGWDRRQPYYRLADFGVHGLLHLLRDDTRVQAFVEHELGELLNYDQRNGTDLVTVLRVYLANGLNKSTTAKELFLSRPSLYDRLSRIEQVLRMDVTASDAALSLHVALRALDCMRGETSRPRGAADTV
ncbi:PucR family transcriptional regulator [Tamaricihabitans halophyticus]|uniref:PucR family transcriptional regulator n=1 Tax=Tamaricihabitans halophyticus TaxID=1262583 RepID=UPI0014052E05|nr:PucR family transcriptional regulator [Tamaricihabitans halophyticus]